MYLAAMIAGWLSCLPGEPTDVVEGFTSVRVSAGFPSDLGWLEAFELKPGLPLVVGLVVPLVADGFLPLVITTDTFLTPAFLISPVNMEAHKGESTKELPPQLLPTNRQPSVSCTF